MLFFIQFELEIFFFRLLQADRLIGAAKKE